MGGEAESKQSKLGRTGKLFVELGVKLEDFELEPVKLELDEGDYLALLGPTGSGKSVLLEAIAGFYPCRGKVILNGRDISKLPPEKRKIGIVYQDFVLFPRMSVYENIAYGRRGSCSLREEVEEVARLMHIEHLLDRKPSTLSGGEKQRVAIARALVAEPELLLMDEPFSALDARTKDGLRELVRKTVKELGITVIHATHDLDDTFLANRVCVLVRRGKKSRVVQQGYVNDVFSYPAKEVAELCGINYLVGYARKAGKFVEVEVGSLRLLGKAKEQFEGAAAICIRPENFRIPVNSVDGESERCKRLTNVVKCEVLDVHRHFHLVWMRVRAGGVVFRCCFTPHFLNLLRSSRWLLLEVRPEDVCVYPLGGGLSECGEAL